MDFLLSHWHCILPVIAIIVGIILTREKPEKKPGVNERPSEIQSPQNDKKGKSEVN